MSANALFIRIATHAVCAAILFLSGSAQASAWLDSLVAPPIDPLLAMPPRLNLDVVNVDDANVVKCGDVRFEARTPLELADAVDLALCNNPHIQAAWAAIKVQAAQVGEARAAYLPTIYAGMSNQNQKTRFHDLPDPAKRLGSDSNFATLTWRLLDSGARAANNRYAESLLESAIASRDAALQRTLSNVVAAYFDAKTSSSSRASKRRNATLARRTLDAAEKRELAGVGSRPETLQAKTALAKAELDSGRATGTHEKATASLLIAIGMPLTQVADQEIQLAPDAFAGSNDVHKDLQNWLLLAQQEHPALLAARAQLQSVREKLSIAKSEGLPTLDLTHSHYVNGRPNQGLSSARSQEAVTGISLNIPLFDGFGRLYKIRGAQSQVQVKEADLQAAENEILGDVVKAHADASSGFRNLEASKKLIEVATEAQESVAKKFDRGVADILEMLSVQAALADAEYERVRAVSEWQSARLRLLAAAGSMGRDDIPGHR